MERTDLMEEIVERYSLKFEDILGQEYPKRALEIAAAGMHNILLLGPNGAGKTTLARSLATILPGLPPFREATPSVGRKAMVGGGKNLKKGEIALAHGGVLFLDELAEFGKPVLEALIGPMGNRVQTVSNDDDAITYPASFILLATMKTCPCGNMGGDSQPCLCKPEDVKKYQGRIPRDVRGGFDLVIDVRKVSVNAFLHPKQGETSESVRARVASAAEKAKNRMGDLGLGRNAEMGRGQIVKYCQMDEATSELMKTAMRQMDLSFGSSLRVLRVARTIADLAGDKEIVAAHVAEALQYQNPGVWMA
jgi:magnesium chelatase family protein